MTNILFLLKIPPPVHGSTIMNEIVANSRLVNSKDDVLQQSISSDTEDIGKFSFRKITKVIWNYVSLIKMLFKKRPIFVYFALSPLGSAFLKDAISVFIIKVFRVPIVFHLHGKGIKAASKKPMLNSIYKYVFKSERAIVLSDYLKYDIEKFDLKKIFVLGNGIKDVAYSDENIHEEFTITYLSNFIKEKGVINFIEVLEKLQKKGHIFRINLIGNPTDISNDVILERIKDCGLEKYLNHFGPAYGEEKLELLSESDLFIFPTYYTNECYPLVLLEAMRAGLPIITSSEGGIRDIVIDGENGFIVDPTDISKMASKAELLKEDTQLRKKMSKRARNLFEKKNTFVAFIDNLENILDKIYSDLNQ